MTCDYVSLVSSSVEIISKSEQIFFRLSSLSDQKSAPYRVRVVLMRGWKCSVIQENKTPHRRRFQLNASGTQLHLSFFYYFS